MGTVVDEQASDRVAVTVLAAQEWREQVEPGSNAQKASETKGKRRGKRKSQATQTKLRFDADGRGRFKGIEPTILNGEDLDIPTFIRRRIPIEK